MELYRISYSSRLAWADHQNRISEIIEQKRLSGEEIIDLTESNPTNVGLEYPNDQIIQALSSPDSMVYHPNAAGMGQAREAIVRYYQEHAIHLDKDQILLTSSTSEGYSYLFRLLTNPGDHLLIPQPSYPLFEYLTALDSVCVDHYNIVYTNDNWKISIDSIQRAIYASTRAVLAVNPNNPTGNFVNQLEMDSLRDICLKNGLPLVIDEVFVDYNINRGYTSLDFPDDILTFTLSGLSKVSGLPQMKLSWIVVRGPKRLREQAMQRLTVIADMYLSVSTPVQHAASNYLELRKVIQPLIIDRVKDNLMYLKSCLSNTMAEVLNVEAGWYSVIRLPDFKNDEDWVAGILDQCNILLHPGYFYNFQNEAFLVCSLLISPKTSKTEFQRLSVYLKHIVE